MADRARLRAAGDKHRVRTGRLFRIARGMYAVGRPNLTERGRWMAAVLWGIVDLVEIQIHVSVPASVVRTRPGVVVHRRAWLPGTDGVTHHGIPVTSPVETLIDLAADLDDSTVEAAVKEADTLDLIDPGPRSPP